MDKPNDHSTLSYMRTYIKNKKLNDKPIKLNMKRAETIKHLRKLGHWDSSVDGQKKPKAGIDVKGTSKKRVTVGKEEIAKKRLDEYVKLHVKYIDTFGDKGLSKFSTFESAKKESDKQLDKMADLVEPISQLLISDYIKKNQKAVILKSKVKSLSNSLEERFDKLPKKKKPAKKEDDVRPVDKDVPKIKSPAKKATPTPTGGKNEQHAKIMIDAGYPSFEQFRKKRLEIENQKNKKQIEIRRELLKYYNSVAEKIRSSNISSMPNYNRKSTAPSELEYTRNQIERHLGFVLNDLISKKKKPEKKPVKSSESKLLQRKGVGSVPPPKIKPPSSTKKIQPPAKKPAPPPAAKDKPRSKKQPPTGPLIAKKDRELYVADFLAKYKQKTNVYKVLKEFDKRLGGKGSAMLVPLDELRKIRKKSIAKLHPDKGGDEEKFKMVNDAFNALIQSYKVPGYKSFSTLLNERRAEAAQAQADAKKKA